jgi:plastocyanin
MAHQPEATIMRRHASVLLTLLAGTFVTIAWAQTIPTPESRPAAQDHAAPGTQQQDAHGAAGAASGRFHILVNPGDPTTAKNYYNRIEVPLNVIFIDDAAPAPGTPKATNLNELLAYFGYQNAAGDGLKAEDLEGIDSFVLMPQNATEFSTLDAVTSGRISRHLSLVDFWDSTAGAPKVHVTRFFAPKIATYYNKTDPFTPIHPDDIVPGWRKIVRLRPRAGSGAAAADLKYAYILFNFKKANADENPFTPNESANNQVILVRKSVNPATQDACYFAVYNKKSDGYPLGLFLAADFDLPGYSSYVSGGSVTADSQYYVPIACAACHGHYNDSANPPNGVFSQAKPNYLDTDQWYDWMDFDFHGVAGSLNDVVFDGGKDYTSPEFKRAFNVLGALNLGIKEDTILVEQPPPDPQFARRAVQKWLDIHQVNAAGVAADVLRKPYSVRGLDDAAAGGWNPADPKEMRLLRLLDNHCFRCHSSVIYHVFDKPEVGSRAPRIKNFLNLASVDALGRPLPGFWMPQGRVLTGATRVEMVDLIKQVFVTPKLNLKSNVVNLTIVARSYAFQINGQDNPLIRVKQGATINITMTYGGGTHDWVLEDAGGAVVTRAPQVSGSATVTHTFNANQLGDFVYFCSIGAHRQLGMEGRLVVEP